MIATKVELEQYDLSQAVHRLPERLALLLCRFPDVWVAGGFLRAIVAGEPVEDIDVFAQDLETLNEIRAEYSRTDPAPRTYTTPNAVSVHFPDTATVQFIRRWFFPTPSACLGGFDFTISQAALWYSKGEGWRSTISPGFYPDLAARRLCYTTCFQDQPGGSLLRVLKFYRRGYRIPLDSLSRVVARLVAGVDFSKVRDHQELPNILQALLYEVDPLMPTDSRAPYLPASASEERRV